MIKTKWENLTAKVDAMSLRERVLMFAAALFLLVTLINSVFLDPLLAKQKKLSKALVQEQEKMKEVQAQLEALLQAKKENENSPLREQIRQIQRQLKEGEVYLKSRRDKLVPPEKMGSLLEQVLGKNGRVQLVNLKTLEATPLIEASTANPGGSAVTVKTGGLERQVYKHGVKITVRGSYADLLNYLYALEKLPTQMFWGSAKMSVNKHPEVELTVTLYTLSLDTIWLQV
ncbi:MAG: type II secretion system protein GspM [Gallionellaceae bacterium]|jgi:MSHA biogenesis protein MshJ